MPVQQCDEKKLVNICKQKEVFSKYRFSCIATTYNGTVKLGDKELFGHPKIVPYPYEVN